MIGIKMQPRLRMSKGGSGTGFPMFVLKASLPREAHLQLFKKVILNTSRKERTGTPVVGFTKRSQSQGGVSRTWRRAKVKK